MLTGWQSAAAQTLGWDEATSSITYGNRSYKMVKVDGGTFIMGATSEQGSDFNIDERPVFSVTLSEYYIGQTEVPQWLWTAVMGNNSSIWKGDDFPVVMVSWDDCQKFMRKLSAAIGKDFKLPTEAQWEFAARGGNKSLGYKYAGSNNIDEVAWYDGDPRRDKPHVVGTKAPNELGLYDMSGNVWEWCNDWWDISYPSSAQTNPNGPSIGWFRVFRGGSIFLDASYCRVSLRRAIAPDYDSVDIGFRPSLQ